MKNNLDIDDIQKEDIVHHNHLKLTIHFLQPRLIFDRPQKKSGSHFPIDFGFQRCIKFVSEQLQNINRGS